MRELYGSRHDFQVDGLQTYYSRLNLVSIMLFSRRGFESSTMYGPITHLCALLESCAAAAVASTLFALESSAFSCAYVGVYVCVK